MRADLHEAWEHPFGRNEYFLGALIGGLFGMSEAKKQRKAAERAAKIPQITETEHTLDLPGMNAAAIEAGYNPMTILNAGGLSAFTKSKSTTTGHNAMAASQVAVPSMGSVFANALGGTLDSLAGSAFKAFAPMSSDYFPPAPAKAGGMAEALGWNTLSNTPAGNPTKGAAQFTAGPSMSKNSPLLGNPIAPVAGETTVTNPWPVQRVDPTIRDAEGVETRSADVVSNAYGVFVTVNDWIYDKTGLTYLQRYNDPNWTSTVGRNSVLEDAKKMGTNDTVRKVITQGLPALMNLGKRPVKPAYSGGGGAW